MNISNDYIFTIAQKIWRADCNFRILTGKEVAALSFCDLDDKSRNVYMNAAIKAAQELTQLTA